MTLKTPTPSAQWLAALSPAPTMKARWAQARPSEARTWGGRRRRGDEGRVVVGKGLCRGEEGQRGGAKKCSVTVASQEPLYHQTMEFYCEACETAMCGECRAGEHREHGTVLLRDVVEQHKAALQRQLEAVRGR